MRLHQPSIRGWLDVSGGGILKGGELCAPIFFKRAPLERPSSADFLGAQEVGPPAGAGPGNLRRRRRLRLGFRPAGPGRMATPYGESKGGLWPSLNARRRSAALAAGEERI